MMLTHQGLAFGALLGMADDSTNVVLEALVQHPVRLVKDKVGYSRSQLAASIPHNYTGGRTD